MRGLIECVSCRQLLPPGDFGMTGRGWGRRRRRECEACRHARLSREHAREAEKRLEIRRRRRERERADAAAARAVAGKE